MMLYVLALTSLLASSVAPRATHRALLGFAERLAEDIGDISQAHTDSKAFPSRAILATIGRTLARLLLLIVLLTLIVANEVSIPCRLALERPAKLAADAEQIIAAAKSDGEPLQAAGSQDDMAVEELKTTLDDSKESAAAALVSSPLVSSPLIARRGPGVTPLKLENHTLFNDDDDDDDDDEDDDDEFEAPGRAIRAIRPPTPPSRVCMPPDEDVAAQPHVAVRAVRPLSPPIKVSRRASSSGSSSSNNSSHWVKSPNSVPTRTLSSPVSQGSTQTEGETIVVVVRSVNKRDSAPASVPSYVKNQANTVPIAEVPTPSPSPEPAALAASLAPSTVYAKESGNIVAAPPAPSKRLSLPIDLPTPPVSPSTSTTNRSIQPIPSRSPSTASRTSFSNLAHKIVHTFDHVPVSSDSDGSDEKEGKKRRRIRPFGSHKDGEARGTRTVKKLVQKLKGETEERKE